MCKNVNHNIFNKNLYCINSFKQIYRFIFYKFEKNKNFYFNEIQNIKFKYGNF